MAATIGDNVRNYRRRAGMNQPQLAEAAGLSFSTVAKVEQGKSVRLETLHMLARGLGIETSALMASSPPEPLTDNDARSLQVMDLRKALTPPLGFPAESSETIDEPDIEALKQVASAMEHAYYEDDYSDISAQLPDLIRAVNSAAEYFGSGSEHDDVLRIRIHVMRMAGKYLTQVRQHDLAYQALANTVRDSQQLGSELDVASGAFWLCFGFLRQGRLAETVELAGRTADRIEPARISATSDDQLAMWGWMHLRVAAGAVRNNEYGVAEHSYKMAASAASAIGREHLIPQSSGKTFGPVTVRVKATEGQMIKGDARSVVTRADQGELNASVRREIGQPDGDTWNRHRLDIAKAHVRLRDHHDGMAELTRLRKRAPEWLRHQQMAREIMEDLLHTRKRTLTTEMRQMASYLGVVG